jgi:CheY-like chemotaxis protein
MREAVAISLTDTGVGIAPEALSQVFEPFFTTKEVGHGTGLGLAQVYGFAQQSGGTVDIRSEVGRGTTVTLYLPKGQARASGGEAPRERAAVQDHPLRILLVEDNAQVAEVARSLLIEKGHSVVHAETADEALAMLNSGLTFDVVFTDFVMPGERDGLDLARIVHEKWPSSFVLLATGYSEAANRAIDEGFTLIMKPYRPEALVAAIQQVTTAHRADTRTNVVPLTRSSK